MCTLAIYFKVAPKWPVIIAANRDEFLDRPATDPALLSDDPQIVGGKDLRAGGTWLGLNEYGLVAGLLNRRPAEESNPDARSRGMLCLDALQRSTAADAARFAGAERGCDYNPFNLLMASREEAYEFTLAGADFVLVDDLVWADPRGAAAALADIGQAIRDAYAETRAAAQAVQG